MLAVVDVVVFLWWCRAWQCIVCVWLSDVLILYVGRVEARLLWRLAWWVMSTQLACWWANSALTSIFKKRLGRQWDCNCVVMYEHVFIGCARGSGGWECRHCCGYWHIFGFDFVTIVCIMFSLLRHCIWLLMMFYFPWAICSISYFGIFFIFQYRVVSFLFMRFVA